MATEAAKPEAAPAKKGKLLWIIIALVVLIGGGAGAWLFLKPKPDAAAQAKAAASKPAAPHAPALYYKFDPAFVVNFGAEGSARYLQVVVEAMTRDPLMLDLIKNNEPAERNDLVVLFSAQTDATLLSPESKDKLRAEALTAMRKVVVGEGGDGKLIEGVYFTSFVIQ
jgi:flagellar FliL protein